MFSASRLSFTCTLLCLFSSALAELFVVSPQSGGTCAAGQPCTVRWMDDGQAPSLANMGACTVGLYHGAQQLVQKLDSVNVGSVTSFTFKPQANAGPNSASYYVAFTSASYKANGTAYISYSPNFSLTGMTGSFNSPVPSLTSSRPAPTTSVAAGSGSALPVSTLNHTVSVSISTNPSGLPKTPTPSMTTARISATASASASASAAPSQSASARPSAAGSSASGGLRGVSVPFALAVVLPILVPIAFL